MEHTRVLGVGLLVAALAVTGCSEPSSPPPAAKDKAATKDGGKKEVHPPHGKGPNGGVVFDLGKHHGEFTVDHDKKECTVLVLNGDNKDAKPLPVAAKDLTVNTRETKTEEGKVVPSMTIKLVPQGEADGKASRYVGTDPGLGNVADFEGTVLGEIDGKPSQGKFKEEPAADQKK